MKNNLKNTVVTGILMAVFVFGATTAQAGLLISDRSTTGETPQCTQPTEESDASYAGLLITDFAKTVTSAITGLLISDRSGLLISDRSGLLISDREEQPTCK